MKSVVRLAAILLMLVSVAADAMAQEKESAFSRHFTWGADVGGAVDMSGNNMSTVDVSANFGYKSKYIELLGAGASLNMMVSNSCRAFPVFAIVRSSFTAKPSLLFAEVRAGASVNYLENNVNQTGLYLSGGIGVRLATGRTFSSHLILSYSYFDRGYIEQQGEYNSLCDLQYMGVKIGISF